MNFVILIPKPAKPDITRNALTVGTEIAIYRKKMEFDAKIVN